MLIDVHLHTNRYSSCGRASPEEMIEGAIGAGLEAVVLTEHDMIWPLHELRVLRRAYPELRIFRGAEVTCNDSRADIIVLGVQDLDWVGQDRRPHQLLKRVHEAGGIGILAHPFRLAPSVPGEFLLSPPDAYEVVSLNMPSFARKRAETLEELWPNARPLAASDAHQVAGLGAYAISLAQDVANESELAAAIWEGAFRISTDLRRLRERYPHWQRIQERVRSLAEQGASYRHIRKETGYSREIVRYVIAGGDLIR